MIKKLTIDKLYISTGPKNGGQYISKKTGEPFKKIDIYAQGLPDGAKSCSGFASKGSPVLEWKEGDTVAVELTKKGQYLNFSPVSEHVVMLLDLRDRVEKLEGIVILGKSAPRKIEAKIRNIDGEPSEEELKQLFGGEI